MHPMHGWVLDLARVTEMFGRIDAYSLVTARSGGGGIVPGDKIMLWQSQHPSLANALHLIWLAVLILTPILISQLLYSALE